jgi:hypothetical protein
VVGTVSLANPFFEFLFLFIFERMKNNGLMRQGTMLKKNDQLEEGNCCRKLEEGSPVMTLQLPLVDPCTKSNTLRTPLERILQDLVEIL